MFLKIRRFEPLHSFFIRTSKRVGVLNIWASMFLILFLINIETRVESMYITPEISAFLLAYRRGEWKILRRRRKPAKQENLTIISVNFLLYLRQCFQRNLFWFLKEISCLKIICKNCINARRLIINIHSVVSEYNYSVITNITLNIFRYPWLRNIEQREASESLRIGYRGRVRAWLHALR